MDEATQGTTFFEIVFLNLTLLKPFTICGPTICQLNSFFSPDISSNIFVTTQLQNLFVVRIP